MTDAKTKTIGGIEWVEQYEQNFLAFKPRRSLKKQLGIWVCHREVGKLSNVITLACHGATPSQAIRRLLAVERSMAKELGDKP